MQLLNLTRWETLIMENENNNPGNTEKETEVTYLPGYVVAGENKDFPQAAHGGDEGTSQSPDQDLIQGLSFQDDLMIAGNAAHAGEMLLRSLEDNPENNRLDQK